MFCPIHIYSYFTHFILIIVLRLEELGVTLNADLMKLVAVTIHLSLVVFLILTSCRILNLRKCPCHHVEFSGLLPPCPDRSRVVEAVVDLNV